PAPVDSELLKKALNSEAPITGRPADLLEPEYAKALAEARSLVPAADDAEVLSYAMFPLVYKSYVKLRAQGLSSDVLNAAALGFVGAMRSPIPPRGESAPPAAVALPAGVSPWAHEGRVRLQAGRR
ncbi:MAG: hypothetical protein L3K09_05160, partial [Thermoplasmata archaeon]|nr:hypothetical protein [Thermoplasmata archaeon]